MSAFCRPASDFPGCWQPPTNAGLPVQDRQLGSPNYVSRERLKSITNKSCAFRTDE